MSKVALRNLLATVIALGVLVPFIGYSVRGSMPFVQESRGMAGVGLLGLLLIVSVYGFEMFRRTRVGGILAGLAVVTIGFGTAALVAENAWWPLVPMIAGLVALWAIAVADDSGYPRRRPTIRHR